MSLRANGKPGHRKPDGVPVPLAVRPEITAASSPDSARTRTVDDNAGRDPPRQRAMALTRGSLIFTHSRRNIV